MRQIKDPHHQSGLDCVDGNYWFFGTLARSSALWFRAILEEYVIMRYLMLLIALLVWSPQAQASMTARQCIDRANELETQARKQKQVPPGEEEAFKDFLKSTMNDMKMLCMRDDMEGAIDIVYQKVCPGFSECDKMKVLMGKGLNAAQKRCIGQVITEFEQNAEMKRQTYLRFDPQALIMMAAIGSNCWPLRSM